MTDKEGFFHIGTCYNLKQENRPETWTCPPSYKKEFNLNTGKVEITKIVEELSTKQIDYYKEVIAVK